MPLLILIALLLLTSPALAEEPTGAIVVGSPARDLARQAYGDSLLRPSIDESMAQVLVGGDPAEGNDKQAEVASIVKALAEAKSDAVRRPLLDSLGKQLGARLVVLVSATESGPTARVLKMPDATFVTVTLAAKRKGGAYDWQDSIGIMRGLLTGPPPGPRSEPAGGTTSKPPDEDESDWDLLTSPWFWVGLGVVVTVGVTVLVLSQTALNEPDTVMLEGRISP